MKYYTGIGSRQVGIKEQKVIKEIGMYLSGAGYTLRSGGANGSDKAFEIGCDKVNGKKEIYLPWEGFNGSKSELIVKDEAYEIAKKYHPNYGRLSEEARSLHARNSHQVLGYDLNTPSTFIIAYCPNETGGTMQALRIAEAYNIPVLNIGLCGSIDNIVDTVSSFLENYIEREV